MKESGVEMLTSTGRRFSTGAALPHMIWGLVAGRSVNQIGAFTLPFLTLTLTGSFGASNVAAGFLMAAFGSATLLSRLLGGLLARRVGYRPTILIGLCTTAGAQLGLALAPSLWWAGLAVVLLGIGFEIYEPPSQALIAEYVEPALQPRAYSLMSAALATAGVFAGVWAALLSTVDLRLLFVVDAASCLLAAALLAIVLQGVSRGGGTPRPRRSPASRNPLHDARMRWLFAAGAVFAIIYTQLNSTLPLTLREFGIGPSAFGLILAESAVILLLCQPLMSRRPMVNLSTMGALSLGYALLGVGLLLTSVSSNIWHFAASAAVWSLADLILLGRSSSLVAAIAPPGQAASYFAVYGLTWGIAAIVGPPAGTALLSSLGPTWLWITLACAAVGLSLGHAIVNWHHKQHRVDQRDSRQCDGEMVE